MRDFFGFDARRVAVFDGAQGFVNILQSAPADHALQGDSRVFGEQVFEYFGFEVVARLQADVRGFAADAEVLVVDLHERGGAHAGARADYCYRAAQVVVDVVDGFDVVRCELRYG